MTDLTTTHYFLTRSRKIRMVTVTQKDLKNFSRRKNKDKKKTLKRLRSLKRMKTKKTKNPKRSLKVSV